jgi:hypothetical protein
MRVLAIWIEHPLGGQASGEMVTSSKLLPTRIRAASMVVQQFNQSVDGGDCVTRAGAIHSLCCYEVGWESGVSK